MSKLTDAELKSLETNCAYALERDGLNTIDPMKLSFILTEIRDSRRLLRKREVVAWGVRWNQHTVHPERAVFNTQERRDVFIDELYASDPGPCVRRFRVVRGAK